MTINRKETIPVEPQTKLWEVRDSTGVAISLAHSKGETDGGKTRKGLRIEVADRLRNDVVKHDIGQHKDRLVVTQALDYDVAAELGEAIVEATDAWYDYGEDVPYTKRSDIKNNRGSTFTTSRPFKRTALTSGSSGNIQPKKVEVDRYFPNNGFSVSKTHGVIRIGDKGAAALTKAQALELSDGLRLLAGALK